MREEVKKLKKLIEASESILITSHISPDPDAASSLLLTGTVLKTNFPDKKIVMALEEEPLDLEFLPGFKEIQFGKLTNALAETKPQLLIVVDANNFNRCSRLDGDAARQYIQQNNIKTAIIDHHELTDKDEVDVFINRMQPAAVQTVYELMLHDMKLRRPIGAAETAMVGFYADTGSFAYLKAGGSSKVFAFAEELVEAGADVETAKNQLSSYSEADMRALAELVGNVSHDSDYTFSFISDQFVNKWLESGHTQARLQKGAGLFLDEFIRNIDGRTWGFIVYKNTLQGQEMYSASFRATGGTKDVSIIANALGGGGHKSAAGAKFPAQSLEDAVSKVKHVIENTG